MIAAWASQVRCFDESVVRILHKFVVCGSMPQVLFDVSKFFIPLAVQKMLVFYLKIRNYLMGAFGGQVLDTTRKKGGDGRSKALCR